MPLIPVLLFIVFLVLKLVGVVAWSWWWVTAPLWGSAILGFIGGLVALVWIFILSKIIRWFDE